MYLIKTILRHAGHGISAVLAAVFLTCALAGPGTARAALFTVDEASDLYDPIGDFIVAGSQVASSPGQVYDVLQLQTKTLESGSNLDSPPIKGDIPMGDLWSTLNAGGITSSTVLVFGFGLNQTGTVGSNWVDIQDLEMRFELPGGGTYQSYLLDTDTADNTLTVWNYAQGQNTAEARFQVNLGFDFMSAYSADSLESFYIESTIGHTDDGFEIYFLSSGFTADPPVDPDPVPIPSALLLLGSGLACLAPFAGRLTRKSQPV